MLDECKIMWLKFTAKSGVIHFGDLVYGLDLEILMKIIVCYAGGVT
jgi:hypothetical protein